MRYLSLCVTVALLAPAALAQSTADSIQWLTDPAEAVRAAKKNKLPLMVYIIASSRDRDDRLENDQRKAFADAKVKRLVKRFVPLRLSRSANRAALEEFKLPQNINQEIAFIAPDNTIIDRLAPGGVADADSLAQKMGLIWKQYRQRIFDDEVKPTLTDKDAKPPAIADALKTVRRFEILEADRAMIDLLARDGLDAAIGKTAYELLAELSSDAGVKFLIQQAKANETRALDVLDKCSPVGAELMIVECKSEGGFNFRLYQTAAKIAKVKDTKQAAFWEKSTEKARAEELDRVEKAVKRVADRWRSNYGDTR